MTLAPGIYYGISDAEYHSDPCERPSLSSSIARLIVTRSPAHAWAAHPKLNPAHQPKDSTTFDIGRAAHTLLIGAGAGVAVIHADDWRSKAAKEDRDAAREAGETPMLAHQYDAACEMVARTRSMLAANGLGHIFRDPDRGEVTAVAEIDGTLCRARADYICADGWAYDFKTTTDAEFDAVTRSAFGYGYHIQAAHYLATFAAAGQPLKGFRFVFAEKELPHAGCVVELSDEFLLIGETQAAEARRTWRRCLLADEWPAYGALGVQTIYPPAWLAERADGRAAVTRALTPKPKPSREAAAASIKAAAAGAAVNRFNI